MTRCISYARYSSDRQKFGVSEARQLEMAEEWVKKHKKDGYYLDKKKYIDRGVSGRFGANLDPEIGELGELIAEVKAGEIEAGSYLILERIDRFSRASPTRIGGIIGELVEDYGLNIVILHPVEREITPENINTTECTILIALELQLAHDQSEEKSKRLSDAWNRKRAKLREHKVAKQRLPDWLDYNDDKDAFFLNKEKQKAIQYLFDQTISGVGQSTLLKLMNEKYPPISKPTKRTPKPFWNSSYISKLLLDRRLMGELQPYRTEYKKSQTTRLNRKRIRVPDGEPIKNYYPEVVTPEKFYSAQASKSEKFNEQRISTTETINLFPKLLFSAYTGNTFVIQSGRQKRKDGSIYVQKRLIDYGFKNKLKGACNWSIEYYALETVLLDAISEIDLDSFTSNTTSTKAERIKIEKQLAGVISELTDLDKKFKDKKNANNRDRILSLCSQLEEEKLELKQRLKLLDITPEKPSKEAVEGWRDLLCFLNEGTKEQQKEKRLRVRKLIPHFVERIELLPLKAGNNRIITAGMVKLTNGERRVIHVKKQTLGLKRSLITDANLKPLVIYNNCGTVMFPLRHKGRDPDFKQDGIEGVHVAYLMTDNKTFSLKDSPLGDLPTIFSSDLASDLKNLRKFSKLDFKKFFWEYEEGIDPTPIIIRKEPNDGRK